ncbi:radical SAM protein [Bacteriovorax sp. DB6_IX]|uniref:radical SAM protein n=1 Tax=Bacteriovorax sp. DB6_IX TaxID=1353530 RepID=UPI0009DB743F|nr:radical SAM protein [Bacteriovorax sp. DB6_IX]
MFWNFPIVYDEPVFRPPSEGRSLLIQQTIGCSNNKCTYCNMYRSKTYRVRPDSEVLEDIRKAADYYNRIGQLPEKIFLCDGDALGAPMESLERSLKLIAELFPDVKRVGVYATAENMLEKTEEELKRLSELGLKIAYLGLESGCDKVLHLTVKGNTAQEMIEASIKLMNAGIELSVIAMLGLGGQKFTTSHVEETAKVLSAISPNYLSFLTTIPVPGTPYHRMVERGFEMLTVKELLGEMRDILNKASFSRRVLFRTNHVSNMYPIGGTLPDDQEEIVNLLENWYEEAPVGTYPPKPAHM